MSDEPFYALVIVPGHGSEWLRDCHWEGEYVVGTGEDYSVTDPATGRPESIIETYPRSFVLKTSPR